MNWDAIGAIGEIVGAIAVVVSLAYLAIQIRGQNKESRLAAMHEIAVAYRESNIPFADANLADILTRAHNDTTQLTEAEIVQLIVSVQGVFRVWEEAYYQHSAGRVLSQEFTPSLATVLFSGRCGIGVDDHLGFAFVVNFATEPVLFKGQGLQPITVWQQIVHCIGHG